MIFVLTGPLHSGKTTLLKEIVSGLRKEGIKVKGFFTEALGRGQEILGYDLLDLEEEKPHPFIRKNGEAGWERRGPYFFIPQALERAKAILRKGRETDLIVVDEVGPLELSEGGLWPALEQVLFTPEVHMLLVVRKNILEKFLAKLQTREVAVFDSAEERSPATIAEKIRKRLAGWKSQL